MLKYTERIYYTYTGTIQTSRNTTETAGKQEQEELN